MSKFLLAVPFALSLCCFATVAKADNWVALKLRGHASVFVNGSWVELKRGDIVSNSAPIRTAKDGLVEFSRDKETISLGPDTQIQIIDRVGSRYTTVKETYGAVRVEANVENVKHFAVETPFLAATVKGTIFTVVSGKRRAEVQVQRGKVRVEDDHHGLHVDVLAGQSATAGQGLMLRTAGTGKLGPILNAADDPVVDPKGQANEKNKKNDKNDGSGDDTANANNNGNKNNGNEKNGNGNNGNGKGNNGNGNGKN